MLRFERLEDDFTRCIKSIKGFENITLRHIQGHSGDEACKSQKLNTCLESDSSLRMLVWQFYKMDFKIYDQYANSESTDCSVQLTAKFI